MCFAPIRPGRSPAALVRPLPVRENPAEATRLPVIFRGQTSECKGSQHQPEVAHGNIIERPGEQQIADNATSG